MNSRRRYVHFATAAVLLAGGGAWLISGNTGLTEPSRPLPGVVGTGGAEPRAGSFKLEASLARLAAGLRAEDEERARAYGLGRRPDGRGNSVQVVAEAFVEPGASSAILNARTSALMAKIAALGGMVETRWRHLVQHVLPVESLESLASNPLVRYVRPPRRPFRQAVMSEGVARTGADIWRNLSPYRADGSTVCVLDLGFAGYKSLLGNELPSEVKTRSFRADGDLEVEEHGTACAEIVRDMAPKAGLLLVNFDTDVEQHRAVDWISRQDVDAISYSLGWFNAGAGDGTGPICADVETAAAANIVWVSAAGNSAGDHWEGDFADPDNDGFHNFSGHDEILEFAVPAYMPVGVFLNWKDFGSWDGYDYGGTDQDFDLYLYFRVGTAWKYIDHSDNRRTGAGAWPTEEIFGWYADREAVWGVAIRSILQTKSVRLELFTYNNTSAIEYPVLSRSISIPADAPGAVAVGATDWTNDALHAYSSRGPTHGGLIKPDFTAPSRVSTATYGLLNFAGTSASVPHVAGAVALLRGWTPFGPAAVLRILQQRAVDLGDPGRDNLYGHGRLNLKK